MTSPGAAIAGIYEFPGRLAGGLSKLQINAIGTPRHIQPAGTRVRRG